jgi:two-component system chemotaxis response regulator CheY
MPGMPESHTRRCLIVDDDLVTRFILKAILDQHFVCDMAENGAETLLAIDQAHHQGSHFDLVCLDINMPGMDGLTVLKLIRENEQALALPADMETRVIIISIEKTSEIVLRSFFECGASSYLTKPINRELLLQALTTLGLV